jgi:hypothetical protein
MSRRYSHLLRSLSPEPPCEPRGSRIRGLLDFGRAGVLHENEALKKENSIRAHDQGQLRASVGSMRQSFQAMKEAHAPLLKDCQILRNENHIISG